METLSQLRVLVPLCTGENHTIHRVGGWVGPRVSLDSVREGNISCTCQDLNPRSFSLEQVTKLTVQTRLYIITKINF